MVKNQNEREREIASHLQVVCMFLASVGGGFEIIFFLALTLRVMCAGCMSGSSNLERERRILRMSVSLGKILKNSAYYVLCG